jgi:hypothetical protein
LSRQRNTRFKNKTKPISITLIEGFDSLLHNNKFGSKHVSFDDDDDSVDEGESMINSGRSRVTVPVRLCQ